MRSKVKKFMSNRADAEKSPVSKDTSLTRFNARRHGLCADGLTDLDDVQRYRTSLSDLMREHAPVGSIETFLVETLAFEMVMLLRARRLQAEYLMSALHPPRREKDTLGDLITDFDGKILDPGLPAAISPISVEEVVIHYERYTTGISNRFFRALHSLDRSQRLRQGENVPAPIALDVSVLAETVTRESAHAEPLQPSPVPIDEVETPAAPAVVDAIDAAPGVVNSPPADAEHERVLPAPGKDFAALNPVEGADGETGKMHSRPEAWSPPAPSGPIWRRR